MIFILFFFVSGTKYFDFQAIFWSTCRKFLKLNLAFLESLGYFLQFETSFVTIGATIRTEGKNIMLLFSSSLHVELLCGCSWNMSQTFKRFANYSWLLFFCSNVNRKRFFKPIYKPILSPEQSVLSPEQKSNFLKSLLLLIYTFDYNDVNIKTLKILWSLWLGNELLSENLQESWILKLNANFDVFKIQLFVSGTEIQIVLVSQSYIQQSLKNTFLMPY